MSCQFKGTENEVISEINMFLGDRLHPSTFEYVNEYCVDPGDPFNGLFFRSGKPFRYIINETRKTCYSLDTTLFYGDNDMVYNDSDPLPLLMRFGRVSDPGLWLGDIILVADRIDEKKYTLLDRMRLDW